VLKEGAAGRCRVRQVRNGELRACGYGRLTSVSVDPVEKKPLHHFFPGRGILSIGGWGCNLACSFCQNWQISQRMEEHATAEVHPSRVVEMALAEDSFGIAYTYNEPLVGIEYVLDCGALARAKGLKNVLVTNGYVNQGPACDILAVTDALNLDIKGMDPSFYPSLCKGTLAPVLDFAREAVSAGCHVEITCLLIPGCNERAEQVRALAVWIKDNLGVSVPLHLSAYHPQYRMTVPPTGVAALSDACKCAREVLPYVYVGNVPGGGWSDTTCPGCGNMLVRRRGYEVAIEGIDGRRCARCSRTVDMVLG
jgi:pyruvate formate lyase activating enzyme